MVKNDDQEADQFLQDMQALADRWRQRLADPALQAGIKAGKVQISPLVHQLLSAFPPRKKSEENGKTS